MKKFTKLVALLLAVAMLLSLAACGSGSSSGNGDAKTEQKQEEVAKVDEKNVVRILTHRTWSDVLQLESRAGNIPWVYWSNSLLYYDYTEDYKPELATSWEWNEAGDEITFHLQENAYFSNGEPLLAEDVVFTYERHINEPTAYNNIITNFIESVKADDDHTVTFHLHTVGPRVWEAFFNVGIMDKSGYEADPETYRAHPYGTGGWKLTEYDVTTKEYHFERWDESWWWDWYGYSSNVDEIIFTYNAEESSRISALRAGEVDIIESVSADSISILTNEGFVVNNRAAVNRNKLGLNVHNGKVFNDINLREAVAIAIDRQAIVDSILGGTNYVYTWPCRADQMGYSDENVYEYNPDRAKELVANSGYNGETLEMIICNSYVVNAAECAQAVEAYLEAVGFVVNVSVLEAGTYEELKKAGEYDINFTDLGGSVGEDLKFIWEIYGHDQFGTGYLSDISTDLNDLANIMDATMDNNEQRKLREEFFKIMADQYAPYILLWSDTTCGATTEQITDVVWRPDIQSQYYFTINKT